MLHVACSPVRRHRARRGASAVEYVFLAVAVMIAVSAAVRHLGVRVARASTDAASCLDGACAGGGGGAGGTSSTASALTANGGATRGLDVGTTALTAANAGEGTSASRPPPPTRLVLDDGPIPEERGTMDRNLLLVGGEPSPAAEQARRDNAELRRLDDKTKRGERLTPEERAFVTSQLHPRITDRGAAEISAGLRVERNADATVGVPGANVTTRATANTKLAVGASTERGPFVESSTQFESSNRATLGEVTAYHAENAGTTQNLRDGKTEIATQTRTGVEVHREVGPGGVNVYGETQYKDDQRTYAAGVEGSVRTRTGAEVVANAEVNVRPPQGTAANAEIARRVSRNDEMLQGWRGRFPR